VTPEVIVVVSGKVGFDEAVADMLDMPEVIDVVGVSVSGAVGLVGVPVVVCDCCPPVLDPVALAVPATSSPPQAITNRLPAVAIDATLFHKILHRIF
jgi:hypothetical protein